MRGEHPKTTPLENTRRSAAEEQSMAVAEASREQEWKSKSLIASLFMGDFDMGLAFPFPLQSSNDKAIGDAISREVDAWARQHIDGAEIDRVGKIPEHVYAGLQKLGLFAIKIPKEYGGLGLSQTNYMRLLAVIGKYCTSTAVLLSAHQSIGLPQPLKLFGTPEQKKKYLPRIAQGEITAFALTEKDVGSDPANVQTHAELSRDGQFWILNGEKLWCTNGVIADLYVVMARTPDRMENGQATKQITAFIVEGRWKGVEVLHRCEFMGLKGIENGLIRFNEVKVPIDNVIGEVGHGLKLALATLNDGRLSIPALSAAATLELAGFCNLWGKSRVQWGRPVGSHEPGMQKLAYLNSVAYAMESLSSYTAQLSDAGSVDIRMEAAAAKLWATEEFWKALDAGIQLRGGRGYETDRSLEQRGETSLPLERWMRDTRVNRILEGSTEIMHLFLAREAMDPHFKKAGALLSRASSQEKLQALLRCAAFYPFWYVKLWLGSLVAFFRPYSGFEPELARQLRWIDRQSKKLARTLFHQMLKYRAAMEYKQLLLGRLVDTGIELAVMALVASRVQGEVSAGREANLPRALYWLKSRRLFVKQLFHSIHENDDKLCKDLATRILKDSPGLSIPAKPDLHPLPRVFGKDLTQTV
ncbi:MAG TPA: acyl-CoA dehydrogenase family protein [Oligoflexus sp.]|uniref:acyl-CoA dehydrogenase family protein n=1 Tax=Oligoflexus sp. TaxID=1971216 RepID=UPI002D2AF947|nr:acyl-CoA dehydrogenase family protein [Oligoflexus sp.]HYX34204.1 acyl-CoA dehydrogenase family protein [Oligoflexus sp.]